MVLKMSKTTRDFTSSTKLSRLKQEFPDRAELIFSDSGVVLQYFLTIFYFIVGNNVKVGGYHKGIFCCGTWLCTA